jgi:hypothetical protein
MYSWIFVDIGTEAKCNQRHYNLPGRCDGIKCKNFCIQQKFESGTCGWTENPDEILCYCVICDDKTSFDGDMNIQYLMDTSPVQD